MDHVDLENLNFDLLKIGTIQPLAFDNFFYFSQHYTSFYGQTQSKNPNIVR